MRKLTKILAVAAIAGAAGVPVSTHLYPEVAAHVMRVTETALARVAGLGRPDPERALRGARRPARDPSAPRTRTVLGRGGGRAVPRAVRG